MFQLESEMRQPVVDWLKREGFFPVVEFQLWHMADIVAGRYGDRPAKNRKPPLLESIAVELKLENVAGVISQAIMNLGQVDWSFCAMPRERIERMRPQTVIKFSDAGVGLLAVDESVETVVASGAGDGAKRRVQSNLWRRVRREWTQNQGT